MAFWDTVPFWAYDFCYYHVAAGIVGVLYGIWVLWQVLTLPGFVRKFLPTASITIAMVLLMTLSAVLSLMNFWVCRAALRPTGAKEAFADKCASKDDCLAVNGSPQGPLCECGGRGFCAGCVMRNNMEPAMASEYSNEFASLSEGFRVQAPPRMPRRSRQA